MSKGVREAVVPEERYQTLRKRIVGLLKETPRGGRELAARLRIPEGDVYEHLEHIRRTMSKGEYRLTVAPARCERCGFVFAKRARLKRPGKCPICHSESLEEPVFSVRPSRRSGG